jgi:hypothetical protein
MAEDMTPEQLADATREAAVARLRQTFDEERQRPPRRRFELERLPLSYCPCRSSRYAACARDTCRSNGEAARLQGLRHALAQPLQRPLNAARDSVGLAPCIYGR